jgi:hypothetical protein
VLTAVTDGVAPPPNLIGRKNGHVATAVGIISATAKFEDHGRIVDAVASPSRS